MKKILLTAIMCCCFSVLAQAQWATQNPGFPVGRVIFDIHAVDQNVAWAVPLDFLGSSLVQEFTRTTNGGTTWTMGQIPGSSGFQVFSITALDANTAWAGLTDPVSGGGKIMQTSDGGATWVHQSSATFSAPDGYLNNIHFFNSTEGVAMGDPNGGYFEIYTTTDGGTTWARVPQANIPANLTDEYGSATYAAVGNTIWFGTLEGRVLKSADKGVTWTVATTPVASISNISFRDAQNGLASSDNILLETTDGGLTWTVITPTGNFREIGLDFVPGANVYISTGFMTGDEGSSYSPDNGQTWIDIESTLLHSVVDFVDASTGWSGSFSTGPNGVFKFTGNILGQQKDFLSQSFSVAPNPSAGRFTLTLEQEHKAGAEVWVTDLAGRTVMQPVKSDAVAGQFQLDLGGLAKGVYIMHVRSAGGQTGSKKIILQ